MSEISYIELTCLGLFYLIFTWFIVFLHRRAVLRSANQIGTPLVVPIALSEVVALSSIRVYIPKDLRTPEARALGIKVSKDLSL